MRHSLRLFLNGGGDAPDSRPVDEAFAAAVGSGKVLYWPFARDPSSYASCLSWFTSFMGSLGIHRLTMWNSLEDQAPSLEEFAGLYIGGGDTFRLRDTVGAANFGPVLRDACFHGLPVFGGSAGAIFLGADISTWLPAGMDMPGLGAAAGLDLLSGHSIWAEYSLGDEQRARGWCADRGGQLLGLSVAAGLIIEGGRARACGRDDAVRISSAGTQCVAHGKVIDGV